MKHKFLIIIILSLFFFQTKAEIAIFKHHGINQGLSNIKIRSITEDHMGLMWIGTDTALFSFDGTSFSPSNSPHIHDDLNIKNLFVLESNDVLIGTRDRGLLIQKNNQITQVSHKELKNKTIYGITQGPDNTVWLATESGLFQFYNNTIKRLNNKHLDHLNKQTVQTIKRLDQQFIAIGLDNTLYIYDCLDQSIIPIHLDGDIQIHDAHKDHKGLLWIATSQGLFRYNFDTKVALLAPMIEQTTRVLSIKAHQDKLWIASIGEGLYQIDINTLASQRFTHNPNLTYSISDNNIMAMHISHDGNLWAGGFYQGLNVLNLNYLSFNFETNQKNSIDCASSALILSIETDIDGSLWLGSNDGLIHWNPNNKECELIDHRDSLTSKTFTVYATSSNDKQVWIASSLGLMSFDKHSRNLTLHSTNLENLAVFNVHQMKNEDLLIGTSKGLYRYNASDDSYHKMEVPDQKFESYSYARHFIETNNHLYIPTHKGLLFLDENNRLQTFTAHDDFFMDKTIETLAINDKGDLFISVNGFGVYHLNQQLQLLHVYFEQIQRKNILKILTHDNRLWMSSDEGIITLNLDSQKIQFFSSEAHNNYLALSKSSHKADSNQLYFGGNSGLIHFDPNDINIEVKNYPLILKHLYLMNKPVELNSQTETGFSLTTPVNKAQVLNFSHHDKVIGFGFVQPNYTKPQDIEYRYKLSPISSQWSPLDSRDQLLTFTNLKAGNYQLDIEARLYNQKSHKSLEFSVQNPPWLRWWAFVMYASCLVLFIYVFVKRKMANQQKINDYLNRQVKQQTSHIAQQKKVVEDLMARKNEIFSNVSHEFRTPITLILGPIEAMLKIEKDPTKKHNFAMVTRNAKHLLALVNQMLKLSQISETDNTDKQLQSLSSQLNMIIEPFTYLAKVNQVDLIVEPFDDINLALTEDALQTIMSNFLSNAIKYTDSAGEVRVGTRQFDGHIEIFVKDNGKGIAHVDQKKIFKRFERLHQGTAQGTGIGLALVNELADLNQAKITVKSEPNKGSEFAIKFPIDSSLQNRQISTQPIDLTNIDQIEPSILSNKQTVLIIDDNRDMRLYIQHVLCESFHCILADGGNNGIAKAVKNVPDIIVCDIMMPVVDGFQVCRQLRNEEITSHIPFVLLTAVNEKASRIKGWRENIDRYLSKPFDAQELILQLKNILNTRQLLMSDYQNKASATHQSYFSEIDQNFIDRLTTIIKKEYSDPLFNVEKMASLMMISDRQLQRKIKGLLDRSPMDLLREHRLFKASQLLKHGKQIAYTSDVCGFSHAAHFSYTFKRRFGMNPKSYQKINQNKD